MGIAAVRRSVVLLGVAAVGLAGLSFLYFDRMAFVARCSWNGNDLSVCSCTHRALPHLPPDYRSAALSWSHQSSVEYAQTIMTAAAWRTLHHATGVDRNLLASRKLQDWMGAAARRSGWWAAKKAAERFAGVTLGPVVAAVPVVLREGGDLFTANSKVLGVG